MTLGDMWPKVKFTFFFFFLGDVQVWQKTKCMLPLSLPSYTFKWRSSDLSGNVSWMLVRCEFMGEVGSLFPIKGHTTFIHFRYRLSLDPDLTSGQSYSTGWGRAEMSGDRLRGRHIRISATLHTFLPFNATCSSILSFFFFLSLR